MDVTDFGSVEKEEASSSLQKRKEKEESNVNLIASAIYFLC